MEIPYRPLSPIDALRVYADWLLSQRISEPFPFFNCTEPNRPPSAEWYMVFYPLRALLLASDLLGDPKYREAALPFIDLYVSEQLPNGGFTSNFRRQPTAGLSKAQYHEILRTGKVNLADNGSNVTGLIQAAMRVDGERRNRYLEAARRWCDEWVPIWALPEGGYGNGIWQGQKINSPYSSAIANVSTALSAFTLATGDRTFVQNAERAILFQCDNWLDNGQPILLDCYPLPRKTAGNDFGRSFYLLEGMCWTHHVSRDQKVRDRIAQRLREWFFGNEGLLSQWRGQWFNFQIVAYPPDWEVVPGLPMSRMGLRPGWEFAKSNGILHAFSYYLNHIDDDARIRRCFEAGVQYLSHPLRARMSGVASEPETNYGCFAVQSTGFAGLSLAEAIHKDAVFNIAAGS